MSSHRPSTVEKTFSSLNAYSLSAVTSSFELGSIHSIAFFIKTATGVIAGAKFIVQFSDDDSTWYSDLESLTDAVPTGTTNIIIRSNNTIGLYVRLCVYTRSTIASTVIVKLVS